MSAMQYEIKSRYDGKVKFIADIDCDEYASEAEKRGAAVMWAVKNGADLTGTNLAGAYIAGVHGINDYIKCIQIADYPIAYTADMLQIGCEQHAIEEWRTFDNARIAKMDGNTALKFWAKYKDWIFQTIELCPAKPTKEA